MNNFGLLKAITSSIASSNDISIAILTFISLNFVLTSINVWFQFRLKRKDKELHRSNLIEEKRIKINEELFSKFQKLNYFEPKPNNSSYLKQITSLERFVNTNRLYIKKSVSKLVVKFTDYHKSVLTDIRKKNIVVEDKIIDEFAKIFNK